MPSLQQNEPQDYPSYQGHLPAGSIFYRLEGHTDDRGCFTEVYREEWDLPIEPRQWSIVSSKAHVLRGMHLHQRHDEYFMLLSGRALVGLHDLRKDASTFGLGCLIEFNEPAAWCLAFPRGVVHGWYFSEPSVHFQGVSESFGSYHPDDNHGCHFADPALGISWPNPEPILSPRAAAFPTLAQLRSRIGD